VKYALRSVGFPKSQKAYVNSIDQNGIVIITDEQRLAIKFDTYERAARIGHAIGCTVVCIAPRKVPALAGGDGS
jgi:hypothetical protein